jgi:hypothetical protein
VDRGQHSLEVVTLLFSLKLMHPKRVHMIRGNHETRMINMMYGFSQECSARFGMNGEAVWDAVNRVRSLMLSPAMTPKYLRCCCVP